MFISSFHQADLKKLAVKLTGEFRWEMCKRIQGASWSDITSPSLTSEYVDYLQFYTKNRDLSSDAKEVIKSELSRSRNNYRAVFVANYADWLQYESNGTPRLNKVACGIMFAYCPFPVAIREKLKTSTPRYATIARRLDAKLHKRTRFINNLIQKISNTRKMVPYELYHELEFTQL
jgi:hypothetical protein